MIRVLKFSTWIGVSVLAVTLMYVVYERNFSPSRAQPEWPGTADLTWVAPTEFADNSPLTKLSGYIIRYSTQEGIEPRTIIIQDPKSTSYTVKNLAPGTYYFSIRAIEAGGSESAYSNVVAKTIP